MKDDWKGETMPNGYIDVFRYLQKHGAISSRDIKEDLRLGDDFNLDTCMEWWRERIASKQHLKELLEIYKLGDDEFCLVSYLGRVGDALDKISSYLRTINSKM